jgi:hypothetical protein
MGHYVGWAAYSAVILGLTYLSLVLLELPGADRLEQAILILFALFLVEGLAGTALGHVFYQRYLSQNRVVLLLQETPSSQD